jgi:penicillin-binding protein 1C
MWNVSGVAGAAPVWVEIMNRLHRSTQSAAPATPVEVVEQKVMLAGSGRQRREWFLRGTETAVVAAAPAGISPRIVYPAGGTVIALDPDIPADSQKLFFEASPGATDLQWKLNGLSLGPADSIFLWTPNRGKYSLALVDRSGRTIDAVDFEVRGNSTAVFATEKGRTP